MIADIAGNRIKELERELAAAKAEICRYCNAMRKMCLRAGCQSTGSGCKCKFCPNCGAKMDGEKEGV